MRVENNMVLLGELRKVNACEGQSLSNSGNVNRGVRWGINWSFDHHTKGTEGTKMFEVEKYRRLLSMVVAVISQRNGAVLA